MYAIQDIFMMGRFYKLLCFLVGQLVTEFKHITSGFIFVDTTHIMSSLKDLDLTSIQLSFTALYSKAKP